MERKDSISLIEAKNRFRDFSKTCIESSPLYSQLSILISETDQVAALLTHAPTEKAVPPLLFAAVQYVLHEKASHPLASYYPTLRGTKLFDDDTWRWFSEFISENLNDIGDLVAHRSVQTNEPNRAALLRPAMALACSEIRVPAALIEIGCSAGLLLAFDKYRVRYYDKNGHVHWQGGDDGGSPLACEVDDATVLTHLDRPLLIAERIGIDTEPILLSNPDQFRWLKSCIWADSPERLNNLLVAQGILARTSHSLLKGSALDRLHSAIMLLPPRRPVTVISSWLLLYLRPDERNDLIQILTSIAKHRPLWWIDNGPFEDGPYSGNSGYADISYATTHRAALSITTWTANAPTLRVVGLTDSFGRRLSWLCDRMVPKV